MFPRRHHLKQLAAIAALTLGVTGAANAQPAFPSRTLTIVVPFPAGGVTDNLARTLAAELQKSLGKTVVVENKPGGGGQIAAAQLKQAEADGHTLFIGATEMFAINPGLYKKFSYDPARDFVPLTPLVSSSLVLVVPHGSPVDSAQQLAQLARSKAGGVNFASQGAGSIGHLLGELYQNKVGGQFNHIAYKGSAPALQDVMSGQVDLMFDPVITTQPLIKGGKLKALAIAATKRSPQLPEVPTLAELGVPGVDAAVWFGVVVKAGTPAPVVQRLNEEIVKVMKDPAITKRFSELGLEPMPMGSNQFATFMAAEITRWGALVKASGASLD
jgi:tripartite-type tricarboxylate transporter receptor subunit TctC